MLRFGHLGLSFLEHGFGDTAKFLSVPHLRDSIYVEKVQGSTSIPWGHLWPKHYNIDWRSTTRVSVSCLFSPESRLRLMKVHVSTWTDQQGHQALRMVQARLFSPGTWFWHIFYRNCGIEYTLRSEIRWRCYQNNNFTAAKMLINHSIFGYFPMLRHAWKNAPSGVWTQALCGLPACLGNEALFFLRLRRLIVSVSLKMLHEVILAGMGQW